MSRWTDEQLEAISASGCNLLVAAAAGAGKTAVLVERIIRKITDKENPVDIDRLLIVTFTTAAAAEMRQRIGDAIARELEKDPGSRNLQRQAALVNRACITTIHSFCLDVIKNNFHCVDLDPSFRIADETEALLMKVETLEELFEEKYDEEDFSPDFLQLVECYGGSRDDRLIQDMVLDLYEFVQSHPWPEKWLKQSAEAFNVPEGLDFGSTAWGRILIKSAEIELEGCLEAMRRSVDIIQSSHGLEPYLPIFNEDISNMEAILKACKSFDRPSALERSVSWDGLCDAFSSLEFGRLGRCGKDADKTSQEQVKALRDEVKERIKRLKEEIFVLPSAAIAEDLRSIYPLIRCLSGLVMEFGEKYAAKKRDKSLLDFNDLEHFCLKILIEPGEEIVPSKVALALQERFEEILVDEYQDSNLVQEVILTAISRNNAERPNMFMVGDVKQSIYRFRQARPELFLDKYNSYPSEVGSKNRKIMLYKNFRSREEVIHAVNFIFKQIMSESVGELDYSDVEALNPGAEYCPFEESGAWVGGPVELHIIESGAYQPEISDNGENPDEEGEPEGKELSQEPEEQPDVIQAEARVVAGRIKNLVDSGTFMVFDKNTGAYRKAMYRDIVILLRTTRNWSDVFMEELTARGIPAYADTGTGYFRTVEVQTVMSLLQIIDNPMQDIPMLSVLRSSIGAFSPDALADIRLLDREASFYEAMKKMAAEGAGTVAEKTRKFLDRLEGWRQKALYLSTDELIWYLYTDTGYYSYAGAMPGGVQRQANLRVLFERARQYEQTSYKGLFNFINFINRLKRSSGDMGSARVLGENENVVRIMSIHKSKGLEFPVVIVSGCGKNFNLQDMNRGILVHQDLGFGPDFVDCKRRLSYPSMPKQALRYKIRLETLSEEMRILYVAFTRAREKLIITGTVKDLKKSVSRWLECQCPGAAKLPEYEMLKARNYLDWIGPAVLRHRDCSALRELVPGNSGETLEDASSWDVKLWSRKDILQDKAAQLQEQKDFRDWIKDIGERAEHTGYADEIKRRLGWRYPYEVSARLPAKISVTELKRRFSTEMAEEYPAATAYMPPLIKKPAFLETPEGFSPAERGTILHFVMQHVDLDRIRAVLSGAGQDIGLEDDIRLQVEGMVKDELLTPQQAEVVDMAKIARFFRSPIGLRLLNAGKVSREVAFNIELKGSDIYKDMPSVLQEETILVQGVVDCCFEEQGNIVLLDYKTDYVPYGCADSVRERYRTQMEYYATALERITGKKVKEVYIYLFWNGELIDYNEGL